MQLNVYRPKRWVAVKHYSKIVQSFTKCHNSSSIFPSSCASVYAVYDGFIITYKVEKVKWTPIYDDKYRIMNYANFWLPVRNMTSINVKKIKEG